MVFKWHLKWQLLELLILAETTNLKVLNPIAGVNLAQIKNNFIQTQSNNLSEQKYKGIDLSL